MRHLDHSIIQAFQSKREQLEKHFDADVLAYYGEFSSQWLTHYRTCLEGLPSNEGRKPHLVIVLNSPGGEVEAVERMVEMTRRWYTEVSFVVPNLAMSAGTIFCMSGDRIYMDYSSALGPIDPQVQSKDGRWVPALGYLDKFEEILNKAKAGTLTDVEFALAQSQDLAVLRRYEQARDLSVNLLKDWLVRYKFKDWNTHRSDAHKNGCPVTPDEKTKRAQEIADKLSNNSIWHSHGRMIGLDTLRSELRLEIEDYTESEQLRAEIISYHEMLVDYMQRQNWGLLIDARNAYSY